MKASLTIATVVIALTVSCTSQKHGDVVIMGGPIYTMDESHPEAEAVVVKGEKIAFVGGKKEASEWIDKDTKVIDLMGKTMIPGFIEGHGHFIGLGYSIIDLDLTKAKNYDEVIEMVRKASLESEPGKWILGRGWHQEKWEPEPSKLIKGFPTHEQLSLVSPNNPVVLKHASGHAVLVNAYAMKVAGLNQLSKESLRSLTSEGGEIIRDQNGNPTGILNELAMSLINDKIPSSDNERDRKAIELATKACLENGITSFQDAGSDGRDIEFLREAKKNGVLGVRLYVMLSGRDEPLVNEWFNKGPEIDSSHWLTIRSVKLYCDGALGSRGAWLLEPYSDRPGFYGMATVSMDSVLSVSRRAIKAGFQVCSHAIGDRANQEVLNRYEQAFSEAKEKQDFRFRIEHAQHMNPNDIPRFAKLGVIPAMQAVHMSSDRPWAIDRLGEKRIKEGAYVWQSLLKSGAKIVNGTDAPVEPVNPIASFYASVTRKTLKGEPEGGYEPSEKMTRQQALRSYTLDAAYGAFEENFKGSIEKGKLADFTILSKDIMKVDESELLNTEVMMTVVGGKVMMTNDSDKK